MGLSQVGANDSIFTCSLGFMIGISMATMVYEPVFNLGVDQSYSIWPPARGGTERVAFEPSGAAAGS